MKDTYHRCPPLPSSALFVMAFVVAASFTVIFFLLLLPFLSGPRTSNSLLTPWPLAPPAFSSPQVTSKKNLSLASPPTPDFQKCLFWLWVVPWALPSYMSLLPQFKSNSISPGLQWSFIPPLSDSFFFWCWNFITIHFYNNFRFTKKICGAFQYFPHRVSSICNFRKGYI